MASRTRARAAQAARPALTIADLPEAVLVQCLSLLTHAQRQQAALACRRFAALACSPELLRRLDVEVRGLDSLASFVAFVSRHGGHLQHLNFSAVRRQGEDDGSVMAAAAACLTAAGTAGQLTALEVRGIVPATHWLASMRGLSTLYLQPFGGNGQPPLSPALSMLTVLRELQLHGSAANLAPSLRLPRSLTKLAIMVSGKDAMPVQIVQLPALQRLQLEYCSYSAASMEGLSALSGSLTCLRAFGGTLPPSLSALTGLRHLDLAPSDPEDDNAEGLNSALACLLRLTCLALEYDGLDALPPAVHSLPQLRKLYFVSSPPSVEPRQPLPPPGPWSQRLVELATNADVMILSTDALAAAPLLECVCLVSIPEPGTPAFQACWSGPAWRAFWAWAAVHPSLSSISVSVDAFSKGTVWAPFFDAIVELRKVRPSLVVDREYVSFFDRFNA